MKTNYFRFMCVFILASILPVTFSCRDNNHSEGSDTVGTTMDESAGVDARVNETYTNDSVPVDSLNRNIKGTKGTGYGESFSNPKYNDDNN